MATVETILVILGGLIFIGYFGELLSRKFSVPSALLLLGIGFALRLTGYADPAAFMGFQDIFATLALVILLFDGGLSMNVFEVLFKSGRVVVVGLLITILAMIGAAWLFMLMGINPIIGAILGAIAGGIGSSTTISMTKGLSMPDSVKNFLTLESSITDVFSIILAIVFTQALISGSLDFQFISQGIAGRFAIGVFTGLVAGGAATTVLSRIEKGYNYVVTLAIVLMLFSVTDFLAGSGAIAVLTFGLMIGNEATVRKIINPGSNLSYPVIQDLQAEISFFVRTFFFVFLGIVVAIGNVNNFIIALGLMVLLYVIRYVVIYITTAKTQFFEYRNVLSAINPRGLATAALAAYPLIVVQNILKGDPSSPVALLVPQLSALSEIAFYLIILSIVFTTILVPLANRKKKIPEEGFTMNVLESRKKLF